MQSKTRWLHSLRLNSFLGALLLTASSPLIVAQAQNVATPPVRAANQPPRPLAAIGLTPVSNATPQDMLNIRATIGALEISAKNGDANALSYFGATPPIDNSPLEFRTQIMEVAVAAGGALVKQNYTIIIKRAQPVTLSSGSHELWLPRQDDATFAAPSKRFEAPTDALAELEKMVNSQGQPDGDTPAVLDVVASRVGGRWIALRSQKWDGELDEDGPQNAPSIHDFLAAQLVKAPKGRDVGPVIGHFMVQSNGQGWFGVGSAFNQVRRVPAAADSLASIWRDRMAGQDYTIATSHRDFALALAGLRLFDESADEFQKAQLLQPGLIDDNTLKTAEKNREFAPQLQLQRQRETEAKLTFDREHPTYLISALMREQRAQPNVISALRIAMEYSRLAQDDKANEWVGIADQLRQANGVARGDVTWVNVLTDHLKERARTSKEKPSSILRSELFTARVWPDDPYAINFLASLEEAQHTVYNDFGIPMGNTEVILWHNQGEFGRYTSQFSEQGGNEFVAALTLTKLVGTNTGPMVLGEEVNTYTDKTEVGALFGTVAHEYGHVAVRQLARGRFVPIWFNEGVATSVEGGYEGYIPRIRRAANAGVLLDMKEMQDWQVDGTRAFLAYSQANSIVDYIVAPDPGNPNSKWGKKAVLGILREIGNDVPPERAFRDVLGIGQQELWNQWVRNGIR